MHTVTSTRKLIFVSGAYCNSEDMLSLAYFTMKSYITSLDNCAVFL